MSKLGRNINIIYRNYENIDHLDNLFNLKKFCKKNRNNLYLANNIKLSIKLRLNGVYLPSFNNKLNFSGSFSLPKKFKIIGSAHNFKEIFLKMKQGCSCIFLSKLFLVDYDKKAPFLDVVKFNNYPNNIQSKLVPLGGIKISNLNKLKIVNCDSFAVLSEIKKKPAIIDRLF